MSSSFILELKKLIQDQNLDENEFKNLDFYFNEIEKENINLQNKIQSLSLKLEYNLQENKKKNKELIDNILDKVNDGVIFLDKKFNLINANKYFASMLQLIQVDKNLSDEESKLFFWNIIVNKLNLKKSKLNSNYKFEINSIQFELVLIQTENSNLNLDYFIFIIKDISFQNEKNLVLKMNQDILIKKIQLNESELLKLNSNLEKESTVRKAAEANLEYLAFHDQLTGLMNRVAIQKYFMEELITIDPEQKIVVLQIDLNKFKIINDSLGRHIGDEILKLVGKRLQNFIGDQGKVARLGGDEFIILLHSLEDDNNIPIICEEIISYISNEYKIYDHKLNIETCIGISLYPKHSKDFDTLVQFADTAMYSAKELGFGTAQFYSTDMSLDLFEQLNLSNWLKTALNRNEFQLYYQPKLNLKDMKINSMEALIRWNHPVKGKISPTKFIPIAEQTGIISKIGEWILHTACKEITNWNKENKKMKIAINLSPVQFNRGDIHKEIKKIILEYNIDPSQIELEITESGMMRDIQSAIKTLHLFKDMGLNITIDDFGTGYSSLSYLKELPIHNLKIDKSFINGIPNNKKDSSIVKAIIDLGKSLDLYIIAEGIEKEEQFQFLKDIGCDSIQGFLISKPILSSEIMKSNKLKKYF